MAYIYRYLCKLLSTYQLHYVNFTHMIRSYRYYTDFHLMDRANQMIWEDYVCRAQRLIGIPRDCRRIQDCR